MGEAGFNRFIRLTIQQVIAAKNFGRMENMSPVLIPTMSKDMDEQVKLAHNVIEVVDRVNRKFCVILLPYNVERLEISIAQIRLFASKKEEENSNKLSM